MARRCPPRNFSYKTRAILFENPRRQDVTHGPVIDIRKKRINRWDTVVKVFNLAKADKNEIMTEVFKSRAIAVGSPTVSNSYLSSMAGWLEFLKQLKFKNKKAAAFGCYGWSGESVKLLEEKLKEAGFWIFGTDMNGTPSHKWNTSGKLALIIGNEGKGISTNIKKQVDEMITIPMQGHVQSLNASVAAAILMYEVFRNKL